MSGHSKERQRPFEWMQRKAGQWSDWRRRFSFTPKRVGVKSGKTVRIRWGFYLERRRATECFGVEEVERKSTRHTPGTKPYLFIDPRAALAVLFNS